MSDSLLPQITYPIQIIKHYYWKEKPSFLYSVESVNHWTLLAIGGGSIRYGIGNHFGEATAGDIVLCPPNMEFHRTMLTPLSFFFVKFDYVEMETDSEERITYVLSHLFRYKFTTPEQDRLKNNFRYLLNLSSLKDKRYTLKWSSHFLNDIWMMFCMEAETLSQFDKIVHDPVMKDAKHWIDQHACSNVKLKEYAKTLKMHPVQFTRRFQAVFDMTPSQYLSSIRMEKAKSLLVQSEYTIEQIALLCGYDNGYYFSRMFTKYTKINPSKYRKIHFIADRL